MKKQLMILIAAMMITGGMAIFPGTLRAESGMSFGPYVWYAWWLPSFKRYIEGYKDNSVELIPVKATFKMNPAFLYGGFFSLNFSKVSWSTVGAVGQYRAKTSSICYSPMFYLMSSQVQLAPRIYSQKMLKIDIDTTLNFILNAFSKIFIGFKYQNYNLKEQLGSYLGNVVGYVNTKSNFHGLGFGMGVGFTIHLIENFYLLWSFSLTGYMPIVIQRGYFYIIQTLSPPVFPLKQDSKNVEWAIGPNSTLSFAYYIEKASLTISLGFRYQYYYFLSKKKLPAGNINESISDRSDHFFGVNMSVGYSFNFKKKSSENEENKL